MNNVLNKKYDFNYEGTKYYNATKNVTCILLFTSEYKIKHSNSS